MNPLISTLASVGQIICTLFVVGGSVRSLMAKMAQSRQAMSDKTPATPSKGLGLPLPVVILSSVAFVVGLAMLVGLSLRIGPPSRSDMVMLAIVTASMAFDLGAVATLCVYGLFLRHMRWLALELTGAMAQQYEASRIAARLEIEKAILEQRREGVRAELAKLKAELPDAEQPPGQAK